MARRHPDDAAAMAAWIAGLNLPPDTPCWVAAAYWGRQLGRPFTSRDLAAASGMPLQRASSVMTVICRQPPAVLRVTLTYRVSPGAGRQRWVQVTTPPSLEAQVRNELRRAEKPEGGLIRAILSVLQGGRQGTPDPRGLRPCRCGTVFHTEGEPEP